MTEKRPTLNQVFLPTRVLNRFIQDEHQFTGLVGRGRFYNELLYTCTLCKLNIASKVIQSCTSRSNNTIIAKYTLFFIPSDQRVARLNINRLTCQLMRG